jgi:hypothetical protein
MCPKGNGYADGGASDGSSVFVGAGGERRRALPSCACLEHLPELANTHVIMQVPIFRLSLLKRFLNDGYSVYAKVFGLMCMMSALSPAPVLAEGQNTGCRALARGSLCLCGGLSQLNEEEQQDAVVDR